MEFSRQEYWSGLPFPFPGDPYPGIELESPSLEAHSLPSDPFFLLPKHVTVLLIMYVPFPNVPIPVLVSVWFTTVPGVLCPGYTLDLSGVGGAS